MMDQFFPRALLSTCPFSLVLETAVKLLEQGLWKAEERKGEKREKRKHETAGLPTYLPPWGRTILSVNGVATPIIDSFRTG